VSEELLWREIHEAIEEYERLIGGYASYTHQMLERWGPKEAISKLMTDSKIQKGLRILAKADRLDLSFEAIVTRHPGEFPKGVVEAAEWRLERARRGDFG
jgi:hypothetical protein